jgi:hypothetical protein
MEQGKEKKELDSSMDAIQILLKKNPVFSLCFVCLALYGVSMIVFYSR